MSSPYDGQSTTQSVPGISGENTAGGTGISGTSNSGVGVHGESTQNDGISGLAHDDKHSGVFGNNDSDGGSGVTGTSSGGNGVSGIAHNNQCSGVLGTNDSGGGAGVTGTSPTSGYGVSGASNSGVGVHGESTQNDGISGLAHDDKHSGVFGNNDSDGGSGVTGTSSGGNGVSGIAHNNQCSGVLGTNDSDGGAGVTGTSNSAGNGVSGVSISGNGLLGVSTSGVGVRGQSTSGFAGYFDGNVQINGKLTIASGGDIIFADFSEEFDIAVAAETEPGMVMVLNQHGALQPSQQAYDKKVAGVISGAGDFKPGLILDKKESSEGRMPVALMGKVYCKVDASYAPIEMGDLLTTSPTLGACNEGRRSTEGFRVSDWKSITSAWRGSRIDTDSDCTSVTSVSSSWSNF